MICYTIHIVSSIALLPALWTIPAEQFSVLVSHHHIQLLMTQVIIKCASTTADITYPNDRLKTVGIRQHLTE